MTPTKKPPRRGTRKAPVAGARRRAARLPDRVAVRPHRVAIAKAAESRPVVAGIALTHSERVLFPDPGITKLELAHYYEAIADRMVPHVADRPLTLVRCPQGYGGPCFFQKHALEGWPGAVGKVRIREGRGTGGKTATYMRVHDAAGLVALVQMSVLEVHLWGSRADRLEFPDRMVFDLDPDPAVPWARVVEMAHRVRRRLHEFDLESWVKTTGGKGIHVVVPLDRKADWGEVLESSRALAETLERDDPDGITLNMSKARRKGKVFIDIFRNGRGATWVAPYSARARAGAPISAPLAWNDLTARVRPERYTVRDLGRLRPRGKDPWAGMERCRQSLARIRRALRVARSR